MAPRFRADQAALYDLLFGRTGAVQLHVANKGREAEGHSRRFVGVKSGDLKQTIGSRVVRSNPGYNVEVFAGNTAKTAKYVMPHHDGSRPHVIRPKRAQFLRFTVGGKVVYARKVNHPGNRANPFLRKGAQAAGLRVRRR